LKSHILDSKIENELHCICKPICTELYVSMQSLLEPINSPRANSVAKKLEKCEKSKKAETHENHVNGSCVHRFLKDRSSAASIKGRALRGPREDSFASGFPRRSLSFCFRWLPKRRTNCSRDGNRHQRLRGWKRLGMKEMYAQN